MKGIYEKEKKQMKPKSNQQATELVNKIKASILDGSSFRRRVAENLAMPVKYPRNDGVFYNPEWQDDFIGRSVSKERVAEILALIERRRAQREKRG
jgi:hypothetical protein